MAPLGPWDARRRVAVAVSGGADSLALALLAGAWGSPLALIVDHGLRPASAQEAAQTHAKLAARGIPARVLTLTGLAAGAAMPARARSARYGALEAAAAAAGLVDLLLGHHAGDQAETVLMRARRGSGAAGLAGMAAVAEGAMVRRVRPLLPVTPDRLRATVRMAGLDWVEDPSNHDRAFTRAVLRAEIGGEIWPLAESASVRAAERRRTDGASATALASQASLFPEGYAVLREAAVAPAALAGLLRAIGGLDHSPPPRAVAGLAAGLRPLTLGGVQVMAAGRLGPGWLLLREAAAMAPPVPLARGAVWDRRFRAAGRTQPGATLGPLGGDAAAFRGCGLPAAVLRTLPAIRRDGMLSAVPFLGYGAIPGKDREIILRHFTSPACGAPFQG